MTKKTATAITADQIVARAQEMGLEVQEQSAFYKISKDRKAVYVAKNKGALARIDLAGFELQHPAVQALTEEEAKNLRLGKVRGQIMPKKLGSDEQVTEAVELALMALTDGSTGFKFQKKPADEKTAASK
jgi:hypothetical protein